MNFQIILKEYNSDERVTFCARGGDRKLSINRFPLTLSKDIIRICIGCDASLCRREPCHPITAWMDDSHRHSRHDTDALAEDNVEVHLREKYKIRGAIPDGEPRDPRTPNRKIRRYALS